MLTEMTHIDQLRHGAALKHLGRHVRRRARDAILGADERPATAAGSSGSQSLLQQSNSRLSLGHVGQSIVPVAGKLRRRQPGQHA
jgi:hypothetical protein